MNKQTQNNINVSNESFKPLLGDLKKQATSTNPKKLTGSFNALLKDLKEMAAKQNQSKNNNNAKQ